MKTSWTAEERAEVERAIDTADKEAMPHEEAMEPHRQAIREIEGWRDAILGNLGLWIDAFGRCECGTRIFPGDKYCHGSDGPFCEECAPTLGDVRRMYEEDRSQFEDPDEIREWLDGMKDRPDDEKCLSVWEP